MDGNKVRLPLPFTVDGNRPANAPASQREAVVFVERVSYTEARR
jgi:hypothetical protein